MAGNFVNANQQRLYYEIHGAGPPLVLVMGIGYDSSLWGLHQVSDFSKDFRVIVFDNRDVGRSSKSIGDYTIADMADDVVGLLDALDIERAHVLGLSMGAMIGQEFALRHPSRLLKLVLTGTSAANGQSQFDPISTWSFVKSRDPDGMAFAAQQFVWLFSEQFRRNADAVSQTLQLLASNPNPVSPQAYARQASAYVKHDTLERLGQIKAPTLVIAGERDLLTPPWLSREVADRIPGAIFREITGPGASHVLPLERPDEFNAIVRGFLAG